MIPARCILLVTVLALEACAQTPPPPAVDARIAAALAPMSGEGTRPTPPSRLARLVRLPPGVDGWVVDYGRTGNFGWCGTGGCTHELYVAREEGYVLAFSEQVREWRLGRDGRLDIDLHGANCDLAGVSSCPRSYLWDEVAGRLVETVNREGDGYLTGPLFTPAPVDEATYPAVVQEEIARRAAFCHASGGAIDNSDYSAVSTPDLNGDGRRDWILGSKYTACHGGDGSVAGMPATGLSVVVSAGEGWRVALRTPQDGYAVDVATHPARFGVRTDPDCLEGAGCPTRFYVWADGELRPV